MKKIIDSMVNSYKEKKESKKQMEQDIKLFWENFDTLSIDDKKGILDVAEFILEDVSSVNINLEDKEKEAKLKEMADILAALPRKNFFVIFNLIKEKIKNQEAMIGALLPDTEREDSPEEENEHHFGVGSEPIEEKNEIK